MKKSIFVSVIFLLVIVVVILSGCSSTPAPKVQNQPTRLECYQQGVRIVDTETLNGAILDRVSVGDWSIVSWVWQEKDGTVKYLTRSESVSCSQYSIVGK